MNRIEAKATVQYLMRAMGKDYWDYSLKFRLAFVKIILAIWTTEIQK